jgi:hypothetical protein
MPFRSTQQGQPMPANPDIKIFFQGLLILRASDDSKRCVVETLLRPTFSHTLSIEVRAKRAMEPDVIIMRDFGHLQPPGLVIDGGYDEASSVVHKYQPSSFNNPASDGAPEDFRWIVNLEGSLFHGHPLTVNTNATRPGITIKNGIYYFHTAARKTGPITRTGGGEVDQELTAIASIAAASLSLGSQPAVVTWTRGTSHTLKLHKVAGTSYEIYIDNSPLFMDPGSPPHNELHEYYGVLSGFGDKFDLDFHTTSLVGTGKFDTMRSSPNIPCQAIALETPET